MATLKSLLESPDKSVRLQAALAAGTNPENDYIEVLVFYFLVETPFLVNSFSALVSGRTLKVSRCIEEVTCSKDLVLL